MVKYPTRALSNIAMSSPHLLRCLSIHSIQLFVNSILKRMQMECFRKLSEAKNRNEITAMHPELFDIYRKFVENLENARPEELIVRRVLGTLEHSRRSLEASAVREYEKLGIKVMPGMTLEFLVVDSKRKIVRLRDFGNFDRSYYLRLLEKAWKEIEFVFRPIS